MFYMRLERRLLLIISLVLSVVVLLLLLVDVKLDVGFDREIEPFQLVYIGQDTLEQTQKIEEQWQLLDTMPLFAPTKWNASQRLILDHFEKMERNYAYYEPQIQLGQFLEQTNWDLTSRGAVVKEANELFLLRNRYFVDHFAQLNVSVGSLTAAPSGCRIEVTAPDGRRTATVVSLLNTEAQNSEAYLEPFDCTVNYRVGMPEILGPFVLSPSGDVDFDAFAERWIRMNFIAEFAEESGLYAIRIYSPMD